MDKFELLKTRRSELLSAGADIRAQIAEIIDADSFVELSSYSFSKNDYYGEEAQGEGVVTGFATVDGCPFYIVAQNAKVLSGGVSKANCDKICKALAAAQKNDTDVLYILDTKGVQIGEGVTVLEGIAEVLAKMNELRGSVMQLAYVSGDCLGAFSLIPAACDFTFITKNSCIAYTSPAVIAATVKEQKNKAEIGGTIANAKTGLADFVVEDAAEVKAKIGEILSVLPMTCSYNEVGDDLNRSTPSLNEKVCPGCLKTAVFDNGLFVELGKGCADEVVCGLGRIGGVSVGAVIFDGGEEGVSLTPAVVEKINNFVCLLADYDIPLVNFVNTKGISCDYAVSQTTVLKDVSNLIYNLNSVSKIGVVYGKAIGLGYTVFAAKSLGYDYSYAFCNAKISLFDSVEGAYIEYPEAKIQDEQKLAERYADEKQDPINAAKNGYIDNIIEPQFVRQYLISSLQMIVR